MSNEEHLDIWQRNYEEILNHFEDCVKSIVLILSPPSSFLLHSRRKEIDTNDIKADSSTRKCQLKIEELYRINNHLSQQCKYSIPNYSLLTKNNSNNDPEFLSWNYLNKVLQLPAIKNDSSGWSRIPVNLLNSGMVVLDKLKDIYQKLWDARSKSIIQCNEYIKETSKACIHLFYEQVFLDRLPQCIQWIQQCQLKLRKNENIFQPQFEKCELLLRSLRSNTLRNWLPQRLKWEHLLKVLQNMIDSNSFFDDAKINYESLSKKWNRFNIEIELICRNSEILNDTSPKLQFLMQSWIEIVQEVMDIMKKLQYLHSRYLNNEEGLDDINADNDVNNTGSTNNISRCSYNYQQFSSAPSSFCMYHKQKAQQYNSQYQNIKQLYSQLSEYLSDQKKKHAQLLFDPNQLEKLLRESANSNNLNNSKYLNYSHCFSSPDIDLHSIMRINKNIENLEHQSQELSQLLNQSILPHLHKHQELAVQWQLSNSFIQELPTHTQNWQIAVSDEARVLEPLRGLNNQHSSEMCTQAQLCCYQIQSHLNHVEQVHIKGLDHVYYIIRARVNETLNYWHQTWFQSKNYISQLFQFLGQIQKSLADQPSKLRAIYGATTDFRTIQIH